MKDSVKGQVLSRILYAVICILVSCILGAVVELGFNFKVLSLDSAQSGDYSLDISQAQFKGGIYKDGAFFVTEENAEIKFRFERQYVDKLQLDFTIGSRMDAILVQDTFDIYDSPMEEELEISYTNQTTHGTLNIRKDLDGFTLQIPKSVGDSIRGITLKNHFNFNILRFGFFSVVFIVAALIIFYRKLLAKKPEIGFLIISLLVGITMVVTLPIRMNSWDEQIHYNRVNYMLEGQEVSISRSDKDVIDITNLFINSIEDLKDSVTYYNVNDNVIIETKENPGFSLYNVGYATQALMLGIGRFLGIPFYFSFLLGRMGNLLLYSIVCYFAIKYIKKGKMLMTAVALMPTPLFLAASYSYDPTVTAFMMLGFTLILNEFLEPEKPLSIKSFVAFILCMVIGSCPKAVYIPMILIALFLPRTKFKSAKSMWIFKGIIIVAFLMMMSTFVLPMLLNPSNTGDERGGDTSGARQLEVMLSHPFAFADLLINDSIIKNLFPYVLGSSSTIFMAYLGTGSLHFVLLFLLLFVAFTDTRSYHADSELTLMGRYKVVIGLGCAAAMVLIWTALYLSFTPVGANTINGVQPRYYLPLFVPLLMLFNTNKIKIFIKPVIYNTIIFAGISGILLYTVYELIITRYCY